MHEPRARAVGGERDVARGADDVSGEVLVRLPVRGVHDDVRAVLQERTVNGLVVAEVEADRVAVRRGSVETGRDHVDAAFDRQPAHLGAEVPPASGDEDPHPSTIVTGPSLTSSSAITAPNTPRATGTPSAASSSQKRR